MGVNIGTVIALANGIANKVANANFQGLSFKSSDDASTTYSIDFLLNGVATSYDLVLPNGIDGTNITDVNFVGNDLVFTLSDSSLITLTNAKLDLKGDKGEQGLQGLKGDKGDTGLQGLKGADGREIELTKDASYIKWRYVGDSTWTNLVALADLKGDSASVDLTNYALKSWVNEQIANVSGGGKVDLSSYQSKTDDALNTKDKTIVGAINEVFQSVSNGKTLIASAITDKGVVTSNTDSFQIMADNISSILGGSSTNDDTIPTYEGDYRVIFFDDFKNPNIYDNKKWDISYLRTWTATNNSTKKTHYNMTSNSIELYTDDTMTPWCPEYDGDLRVSSIQTGNRSGLHKFGGIGSGGYLQEVPVWLSNVVQYGKLELRAKFSLDSTTQNHIAWWLIGFQDREEERGELDIFEIYPNKYDIVMHSNGDPNITYNYLPLGQDGVNLVNDGQYHIYTVNWDETGFEFFIDGVSKGRMNKSFNYPVINIINMYEKRVTGITRQSFDIDYFKISKKIPTNANKVENLKIVSQTIETVNLQGSNTNYNDIDGIKNISSYVKVMWNDGIETHQPVKWDTPTLEQLSKLINGGEFTLYGDIEGVPFSVINNRASVKINIATTSVVNVTSITLDKETVSLVVGGSTKLEKSILPSEATNKLVLWNSSNLSIVSVDGNGNITAKAVGSAVITVTTVDGNKTDTCTINVVDSVAEIEPLLWLDASDLTSVSSKWNDKTQNGNNFTITGTPYLNNSKGMLMSSANVTGDTNITLSNVFTVDYVFTLSDTVNDYYAFFSFNQDGTTKYCENISSSQNIFKLKVNGYSGDTFTTLKFDVKNLEIEHRITIVYGLSNIKLYYNGVYHSSYSRGTFKSNGDYKIVLGSSSWGSFPIINSKFYLKSFKLYDVENAPE